MRKRIIAAVIAALALAGIGAGTAAAAAGSVTASTEIPLTYFHG